MKILIVEDEYVALTKMQYMLSKFGKCDLAQDGQEALNLFHKAYLNSSRYDLITIDINIPIINGLDLLKIMTKDEILLFIPPAKKIIVTASTSTNYVYQAKDNKCDAYLMKPVKQENLIEKLKAIGII